MLKRKLLQPDFLFVINDFDFLESHRLNLIKHLAKEFRDIVVAVNLKGVSDKRKDLLPKNVVLVDYSLNRSSLGFSNLINLYSLFRILIQFKPVRLFLVSSKPIIFGGISSYFLPVKKVYFNISGLGYSFISNDFKARVTRVILILLYKLVSLNTKVKVIFQNEDDLNFFIKKRIVTREKTTLIRGSGIDTAKFKRNSYKEGIVFLFAGRLLIDKGIREFIKAISEIDENNVSFKIAGNLDKDNPNCLSDNEFSDLQNNKRIEYLGNLNYADMAVVYEESHVFVLPSYREGLPKAALEAGSFSMPLILSDVNGCRDCVLEAQTGFLVERGNAGDLSEKMRLFVEKPYLIDSMGEKSRKYIKLNFSEDKIFPKFLSLFSDETSNTS